MDGGGGGLEAVTSVSRVSGESSELTFDDAAGGDTGGRVGVCGPLVSVDESEGSGEAGGEGLSGGGDEGVGGCGGGSLSSLISVFEAGVR